MRQLVSSRWFALGELGLVSISGAIWYLSPDSGGWPIWIALLPWFARLSIGQFPFRRTKFDLFLLLFVITAGVGVLAAYHRQAALTKFWIIIGAVLIYYALARQPRENLNVIVTAVGALGVIIAMYSLLTTDRSNLKGDLEVIDRLSFLLARVHIDTGLPVIPPNFAGGILGVFLPLNIVLVWSGRGNRANIWKSVAILAVVIVLAGLFMSSSRGAWLACLTGFTLWGLWRGSRYLTTLTNFAVDKIVLALTVVACVTFSALFIADPDRLVELTNRLPGLPSGGSRIELAQSTLKLIEDYPFTGGGLRAFGGNYSRYMMLSPYFLFAYSHNFYLDVFFEQGLAGGGATLAIFGMSVWMLWRIITRKHGRSDDLLLAEAILTGVVILLVHGLIDDPFYGDGGSPLLFLMPGIASALFNDGLDLQKTGQIPRAGLFGGDKRVWFISGGIILLFVLSAVLLSGRSLQAAWYANFAAIKTAQWELRTWPAENLNDLQEVVVPTEVLQGLAKASDLDPSNRTAHHRLGLAYMGARDFGSARDELAIAFRLDPGHRGVQKAFGYALVWAGELDQAIAVLRDIPEAEYELDAYQYWWRARDRQDLAWQSHQIVEILHEINLNKYQRNRTGQ